MKWTLGVCYRRPFSEIKHFQDSKRALKNVDFDTSKTLTKTTIKWKDVKWTPWESRGLPSEIKHFRDFKKSPEKCRFWKCQKPFLDHNKMRELLSGPLRVCFQRPLRWIKNSYSWNKMFLYRHEVIKNTMTRLDIDVLPKVYSPDLYLQIPSERWLCLFIVSKVGPYYRVKGRAFLG